ncbi:DNA-binding NarL/FixJ family response regulator [Skermanella aerolata]|uniref:response regulator transcription factor n=1 Tax=Skermanella aerolata TaxID=393310 RepID=UPI003D1E6B6A
MPACTILIADDHPLMRAALRQTVAQAFPGALILEAGAFDPAMEAIESVSGAVDLILLDLHMPGMNGFIGLFLMRGQYPAIPVVIVSALEDPATVHRALGYGASGFVPKSAPVERIAEALRTVLDGGNWFPELGDGFEDAPEEQDEPDFAARVATLTPQQLRVLAGITAGKLNKQIAFEMAVSEATVKAHVTVILRKLGLYSRTQVIIAAGRLVVEPPREEQAGRATG